MQTPTEFDDLIRESGADLPSDLEPPMTDEERDLSTLSDLLDD